jgi:hypothetical protein
MSGKLAHRSFTVRDSAAWDARCDRAMRAGDAHALEFAETWMFLMEGFIDRANRHGCVTYASIHHILAESAEICRVAAGGDGKGNVSFVWAVYLILEHWAYAENFRVWVAAQPWARFYGFDGSAP